MRSGPKQEAQPICTWFSLLIFSNLRLGTFALTINVPAKQDGRELPLYSLERQGARSTFAFKCSLLFLKQHREVIKVELHPSTGDQKVIFDQQNNFYVTVVKDGDKLLLSGTNL